MMDPNGIGQATDLNDATTGSGTVYAQGWTLDDIQWSRFDASKVEPWVVSAI